MRSRAAVLVMVVLAASSARAQELRFTTTAPGRLVTTGNTLGLAKATGENGPGTRDSIGTFITTGTGVDDNPPNAANPWPAGTTSSWASNGSAAQLDVPEKANVLYAELAWGGSYQYGTEDVTAFLDNAITLSTGGDTLPVMPDAATAQTLSQVAAGGFAVRYYLRSADVTAFVREHGGGTYVAGGIPATQDTSINSLNAAGWTLTVVYRDQGQPIRNFSVFVGGAFVDENSTQDYVVSGFCTPPVGTVRGVAHVSTMEGDANLAGDHLDIAATMAGPFVALSGPNNPVNNFFCSQLNDGTGALDTRGSFGTANHDATNGINAVGARQGWDVTSVVLDSGTGHLANNQSSAVLRASTTGDSFVPVLAALAIDVNAPELANSTWTAEPSTVARGMTLTLTGTLENSGGLVAENVRFAFTAPQGTAFVSMTSDGQAGDITGTPVTAMALAAGVNQGTLAPGETRTVVLQLSVTDAPLEGTYNAAASWTYAFVSCAGMPPLPQRYDQVATVMYDPAPPPASSSSSSMSSSLLSSSAMSQGPSSAAGTSSVMGGASSMGMVASSAGPSSSAPASSAAGSSTGQASSAAGVSSSASSVSAASGGASGAASAATSGGGGDGGGEDEPASGCGCTSSEGPRPAVFLLLGVLAWFTRRRSAQGRVTPSGTRLLR